MALLQHYNYFTTGQFYNFTYSPKWLNRLSVYDKYPMGLFINYDSVYGLISMINFHWLTVAQRAALIDVISRRYPKALLQEWGKAINIDWNIIKTLGPVYRMAWRKYFPNRIRNLKAVATKWDYEELKRDVINSNTSQVIGVTPEYIQRFYAESIARKMRGQTVKQENVQQTVAKNYNQNIVW
jgi:hypothetical protein